MAVNGAVAIRSAEEGCAGVGVGVSPQHSHLRRQRIPQPQQQLGEARKAGSAALDQALQAQQRIHTLRPLHSRRQMGYHSLQL